MPQETNLNVAPYFDDFSIDNNYFRVLFKPGYPVQARELTTLQSILQNQIEQFGKHIFKDGSPVIGGEVIFTSPVYAIQISPTHNGIPIESYILSILNRKQLVLTGQTSGVSAELVGYVSSDQSEKSNHTLYVKYTKGGGDNYENSKFFELENLITQSPIIGENNITIQSGQTAFDTLATGGVEYRGSLCEVNEGIFFVRGYFVKTPRQRIITSQYTTNSSYKVGFKVLESVVNSYQDNSLYDNASGFTNYAAPGSDRFKIDLLFGYTSVDKQDPDFIELLRIENGQPQFIVKKTVYSLIRDELASRTYDESGDYFVNPFTLFARETLNDGYRTFGLYKDSQLTSTGNVPSEDLLTYQIGPGKAYVGGYDVETISNTFVDVVKPRTTKKTENKAIPYNAGSLVILNNVYGTPDIGLGATVAVSLMDTRLGSDKTVSAGTTIGYARVYDYIPETQYVDNTSRMETRLFDVDMVTTLTLTSDVTLSASSRIEGVISKASGFVKVAVASTNTVSLYSVNGTFLDSERIIIDGVESNRYTSSVQEYDFSDVKSLHWTVAGVSTFSGDLVLNLSTRLSDLNTQFNISASSGGISTVTTGLFDVFTNKIKSGDIVSYNDSNFGGTPIYNKVESVSAGGSSFTVSGITTVTGICDGSLPGTDIQVNGVVKIQSQIDLEDSSLVTPLPDSNVSSIDLESNTILQRRQFPNTGVSSNQLSVSVTESDLFFADFDEDNIVITYSDGSLETIRSEKYSLSSDGKTATFVDLSKSSDTANVIATLTNTKPNSIKKNLNKVGSLVVDKSIYTQSGIGTTTLNDGLTYNAYYGLRVQDKDISLNVPDVIRVLAIYESDDTSDPVLPSLSLSSFDGIFNTAEQLNPGDVFEGASSNAVGMVVSPTSSTNIDYVHLNGNNFTLNEKIAFKESGVSASISAINFGSKSILSNYYFDSGQKSYLADYSKIIRKPNVEEPKGKLRILYQNYTTPSTDTGEIITVNSYSDYDYNFDIPTIEGSVRSSDVIDLRPRVKTFTLTNKSPFEYDGKQLNILGRYSSYVLAPNKNLILSYNYYLPRIDVISLNTDGKFEVIQGIPSDSPEIPDLKPKSLDIAVVYLPPYLYRSGDALVDMSIHKRYRMSDISLLEDRIQRVERVTSLNLLEMSTDSIQIIDAETGLNRFKSGFFADDFTTKTYSDTNNPQFKSHLYQNYALLGPIPVIRHLELQLGSEVISGVSTSYDPNVDQNFVSDLGSPGVRKTGDAVTLNYSEVLYVSQPNANTETSVSGLPVVYNGNVYLTPSMDIWFEQSLIERNTFVEGTTTILDTETVENITVNETVQAPDTIRYVDRSKPGNTFRIGNSSSSIRKYESVLPQFANKIERELKSLGYSVTTQNPRNLPGRPS